MRVTEATLFMTGCTRVATRICRAKNFHSANLEKLMRDYPVI